MLTQTRPNWILRVMLALLMMLSLGTLELIAPVSMSTTNVSAQDDDEGGDDDADTSGSGSGNLDEDDNRGHGNDDDGVDDDNPGNGKDKEKNKDKDKDKDKKKDDDEDDFVTAVPTATSKADAGPTQVLLTPVRSPTGAASTPVSTTGTLAISLRDCPASADPADGIDAFEDVCPDGRADAVFELAGRSGLYSGWNRRVTTDADGAARVDDLAEGTYSLTLDELDWCAAEASAIAEGLILIAPGETTEVTAYLCADDGTPAGR